MYEENPIETATHVLAREILILTSKSPTLSVEAKGDEVDALATHVEAVEEVVSYFREKVTSILKKKGVTLHSDFNANEAEKSEFVQELREAASEVAASEAA